MRIVYAEPPTSPHLHRFLMRYQPGTSATVSAFYFLVFLAFGANLPFFTLWLQSIGISEQRIGIIAASPSVVMVLTTFILGSLADKASDWRFAIIVCNFVIAVTVSLLPFVKSFEWLLIVWTVWSVVLLGMMPILDAASIRMARYRQFSFHRMRAMGSVGFIVGVWLIGAVVHYWGIASFLWLLIGLAWFRAFAGLMLPKFKEGLVTPSSDQATTETSSGSLLSAWFLLTLCGSALIHASHGYYYTMGSVIWKDAGYSAGFIANLWVLGVVIEVVVMWLFSSIAKRYSARKLLIFSGVIASLRWLIFGLDPNLPVLLISQALHGVTFGILFLASVNFIANWTPVRVAARAQSLGATLNTASMAIATMFSGFLFQAFGASAYWMMLVPSVLGTLMIVLSLGMQSAERH